MYGIFPKCRHHTLFCYNNFLQNVFFLLPLNLNFKSFTQEILPKSPEIRLYVLGGDYFLDKRFGFTSFNRTDNNELPLATVIAAVMSLLKGAVMSANNT